MALTPAPGLALALALMSAPALVLMLAPMSAPAMALMQSRSHKSWCKRRCSAG